MTPDEFRKWGSDVVDRIARYMEEIEDYPVLSTVQPGDIRAALPTAPPEEPEPFDQILDDVDRVIMPGITHWQSPSFFAYFPGNSSGPSILGDLLSSGLGVQGMLWATSPACTELETHVLDWLVDLCALPEAFRGNGVIQDSASSASLCALLAARGRHDDIGELVAYTSSQAHSSIEKDARIAGLRPDQLRFVDVDETYAMRPDALAAAMRADAEAGRTPFFVTATVGTTSSTALDPVPAIATVCEAHDAWLHVDAAFAGSAAVCPELRFVNDGLELADSYCFNPHKWLLTNFDCSVLYVADRAPLIEALSIVPEYLRNEASESGAVIDYRDWQVPLGRRFRALKLWFVIRSYGASGLAAHIRRHVEAAKDLVTWVEADPRFEVAAPVPLSLVCFRHVDGDEANRALLDRLNASGELYLTHTILDGKITLRLALGGARTERRHVENAWAAISRNADAPA